MLVAFNLKGTFVIMWPSQTSLCHEDFNTFFIGLLIGMDMAVSAALEMKSSTSSAPRGGLQCEDTHPDWPRSGLGMTTADTSYPGTAWCRVSVTTTELLPLWREFVHNSTRENTFENIQHL